MLNSFVFSEIEMDQYGVRNHDLMAGSDFGRGLSFSPKWRSHAGMDESLERIIRQALEEARAKGRDFLKQTELAVRAAQVIRPDLMASEILAAVRLMQNR